MIQHSGKITMNLFHVVPSQQRGRVPQKMIFTYKILNPAHCVIVQLSVFGSRSRLRTLPQFICLTHFALTSASLIKSNNWWDPWVLRKSGNHKYDYVNPAVGLK